MDRIPDQFIGAPIIIGAGLAGLMTALHLAPAPVIVLAKAPLGDGAASGWAQGGIAAAVGADDQAALHAADTLAAGDGLCDVAAVERITAAARAAVEELMRRGVRFDHTGDGRLALGLEAAHGRRRIVHADGDRTGAAIMRALVAAVRRTPSIAVLDDVEARRLMVADGAVIGVLAMTGQRPLMLASTRAVIASGGLGRLYAHTTNPRGALGQGVAMAARAGAVLAEMEFIQFHPTALDAGGDPMPLVSEAVRGEGAVLIDEAGTRFMAGEGRAELAPRDLVARAVWRHIAAGHRTFLDARAALGTRFAARFPGIAAACAAASIDPAREPIPIRPAAHYAMGGIAVDHRGRSSLAGLWACGEAAATGLHGANRLASNSLLEATVSARWVAEDIAGTLPQQPVRLPPVPVPPAPDAAPIRRLMAEKVGVLREAEGLREAVSAFSDLARSDTAAADPALVGLLIAVAAWRRRESRGSHYRGDHPERSPQWQRRLTLTLDTAAALAAEITAASRPLSLGA